MAERLAGDKIAAIYASPLQRTRESAEIVAARLGLPIGFRDDLMELDFGEWTGETFDAIRADPRWQPWNTQRSLAAIPGGESMREVQRRVVEAMLEIGERASATRPSRRGQPWRRDPRRACVRARHAARFLQPNRGRRRARSARCASSRAMITRPRRLTIRASMPCFLQASAPAC